MCVHGSELGNWNTQSLFVVDVVGFFVVVVVFFWFLVLVLVFETGSLCVAMAILELTL